MKASAADSGEEAATETGIEEEAPVIKAGVEVAVMEEAETGRPGMPDIE